MEPISNAAAPQSSEPPRLTILVPGDNVKQEVGSHRFAREVLAAIPPGVLYRQDSVVGELVGQPGKRRFVELRRERLRPIVDRHARLVERRADGRSLQSEPFERYRPCTND